MITVLQVVRHWAFDYDYSKIYLIPCGNRPDLGIRFFGVTANEPDPVVINKRTWGWPDITERDATQFTGIDEREHVKRNTPSGDNITETTRYFFRKKVENWRKKQREKELKRNKQQ